MQKNYDTDYKIAKLSSDLEVVQFDFDIVEIFTKFFPSYFKIVNYFRNIESLNSHEEEAKHPVTIVDRENFESTRQKRNCLRLILLSEPANLFTEKFISEAYASNPKAWQVTGASPHMSKESLLMRRLDSYLDTDADCNLIVQEFTRNKLVGGRTSEQDRLLITKKILTDNFDGVGISERLPETMFWFCGLIKWMRLPRVTADLVRECSGLPNYQDLPMKTQKKIAQRTQLDREIYELAHENLDRICDKLEAKDALRDFKQQWIFASEWRLRENASRIPAKISEFQTQLAEVKKSYDDRIVQTQKAYHLLLKEHLLATNVLDDEK